MNLEIRVFPDGDQFCALVGENLVEGIAGFSYSPTEALRQLADAIELKDAEKAPATQLCDEELDKKLAEYMALREAVRQYESLKKQLKPLFEGQPLTLTPKFKITGALINRKAYTVDACTYWNWQIKPR